MMNLTSTFRCIRQLLQYSCKRNTIRHDSEEGSVPKLIYVDEIDLMTSNMKRIGSRVQNEKKNSNKEHTSVSSRASSTKISSSRSFSSVSSPSSKILWSLRSFNMTKRIHPRRSFKTTRRISSSTSLDDVEDIVEFTISIQTIEDIILNSSRNTPVIGMITLSSQTVVDNRRSKSEIEFNVYSSPLMKKSTSVLAGTSERYYGFFGGVNTNKLEQIKLALPMKKSRIDNPSSTRYIERQIDLTLSLVRGRGTEIEKVGVAVIKLSGEEFGNSMLIPIVQDATRGLDEVTGIHSFMSSDAQSQNGELTEEYTGNPKLRISITARRHPDKKERPDSTTSTYVSKFFPSQPHSSCSDTPRLGTRSSSSSHSLPNSLLSKSSRSYHVMSSDTQSQNGTLTEEYADNTKLRMSSTTTAKRHQDNEERSDSTTSAYVRKFLPSHPHASSYSDIPRLGTRTASSSYSLADSLLSTSRSYDADSSLLFSSTIDEDDSWDNDNEI